MASVAAFSERYRYQVGAIVAIALLGTLFSKTPFPRLAIAGPISYFSTVLGDAGTALVLFAAWRQSRTPRATFVLATSFAVSALITCVAILVLPLMPGNLPVIPAPEQAGRWLYLWWHLGAALGAFAYLAIRRHDETVSPTRRFTFVVVGIAALLVLGSTLLTFIYVDRLPALLVGTSFIGFNSSGAGPVAAAALGLATILMFGIRNPRNIDRAYAISLFALTLDLLLVVCGETRLTIAYYAGRSLVLIASLTVLASIIRSGIVSQARVRDVESTLSHVEGKSLKRAGRIRALLEIAALEFDEARFTTILQIATTAIRPGKMIMGLLSHLEGETVINDAVSWNAKDEAGIIAQVAYPGATFPFRRTLQSLICGDRSQAFDDLACVQGRGLLCDELSVRSFIGTKLTIGRSTYFLTFCSSETMLEEPFAEDDLAYVDGVAAHFGSRVIQQEQFDRIKFQIEHDALTGLENRVQFRNAVRNEISLGKSFSIAFVDIDHFKHVNERVGYQIADEVLVEVGAGLGSVSKDDLVARMSADEFGVLLRGGRSIDSVTTSLKPYAELFATPFHTGDRNGTRMLSLGASIGAARFPDDGTSLEELMRRANVALDTAKTRGGSATLIFDKSMQAILEESVFRVGELADAIAHNHLALVYQPTLDLATRRIVGAEALVRWDHPERGRLLPAQFVNFAERNGLIAPLTRWVLRQVIRDVGQGVLPPGFRVHFNLSAQTLDDLSFIEHLRETLALDPSLAAHLGIEITETAAMQNVERSMRTIELLRRLGLSVAIDDFGTGYSSLSYLKHLTVDVIKIDRSFVASLPDDERGAALTELLLRIMQSFGAVTLAEGIENEEQASWLLNHGCRLGQGFLYAQPDSFAVLLKRVGAPDRQIPH